MIVTIHQPEHMPWLGFLDKVSCADLFVVLDTVQFRKNYFQNRNRIRTPGGWAWITVPVRRPRQVPISEVRIDFEGDRRQRYLNVLENAYRRAPWFDGLQPVVRGLLDGQGDRLVTVNMRIINFLLEYLGIDTPLVLASELGLPLTVGGTEVNHAIAVAVGATTYLSGPSGRAYLDVRTFDESGIRVAFHEFRHPQYRQVQGDFLPAMSAIDLLFNEGPRSRDILRGGCLEPASDGAS
jgi:hypothetical protein